MQFHNHLNIVEYSYSALPLLGPLLTAITTFLYNFFSWLIKKLTIDTFRTVLVYGIIVASWGIYATIIAFAVALTVQISNVIIDFLSLFQSISSSPSTNCISKNIVAGLNSSGLMDGLSSSMPVVNSALQFYILSIFYILLTKLRQMFERGAIEIIRQIGR